MGAFCRTIALQRGRRHVGTSQLRLQQMLGEYEAPALDAGVLAELDEFIGRRKSELPDMYY